MTKNLFAYGTLLVPEIWRHVVGRDFPNEPATLPGYEIRRVRDADYPAVRPSADPAAFVTGRVYRGLDDASLARLDAYEDDLYDRIAVTLLDRSSNPVASDVYVASPIGLSRLSDDGWTLERFLKEDFAAYFQRLIG